MVQSETVEQGRITGLRQEDLDLAATLSSGQAFRWVRDADGAWRGTVAARRVRLLSGETGDSLYWEADGPDAGAFVRSFLRLDDADLPALAEEWSAADPLFAEAWVRQPGVRILRQDPDECFFSFLCASVAPIARISGMLRAVAAECGSDLGDGYTAFPDAAALATASEERLRELGLGFRAKRVAEAARDLQDLPPGHLAALRTQATHEEAKRELRAFFGVGEKIADCVCLFSLDKDGAVPVDVHIWRIAQTRYAPELAGKSLTAANYARATQAFHDRFGPMAGWAQQTLFYRAAVSRLR
jgi:N-glycosylase/DNA lyase